MYKRDAVIVRTTSETEIKLNLNIDGGDISVNTGVGFLDHMLTLFAYHGSFGIELVCKGDTYIDDHHTVEDVGICLGKGFYEAAGDKKGINRFGHILLPMDEALVEAIVDFSGRPFLHYDLAFNSNKTGQFDLQLIEEFFRAFTFNSKLTLHINKRYGRNDHHIAEAAFKGVARALMHSLKVESDKVPSTKGLIE